MKSNSRIDGNQKKGKLIAELPDKKWMHRHENRISGMTRGSPDLNQQHTTNNRVCIILHRYLNSLKDAFIPSHSLRCLTVLPVRKFSLNLDHTVCLL